MDMLEIGFYSAVTVYGLIAVWTVLVRLRWLPTSLVRLAHWPLNRLGRIPYVGRVVNAFRRHPLTLGLVLAILVGAAVPYVVLSVMWVGYLASFGLAIALGAWALFNGSEDGEVEPDPYDMYVEKSGHGLAYGDSPRADLDRPVT
jgi:hypothetical protein